jgi:SAM-dependent methyltransferase
MVAGQVRFHGGTARRQTALMHDGLRLFLFGFLLLFTELVLIRWTAAYVLYLSYFTNFVLLGSFLGIGLGFLRPRADLFRFAPIVLAGLVWFVVLVPTRISHTGARVIYFGGHTGGVPSWVALPAIFVLVTAATMLIAGAAATVFVRLEPLAAYRYDILGSVAGTVTFALMSLAGLGPAAWSIVLAALFLALWGGRALALQALGLGALMLALFAASTSGGRTWSPYYAIKVTPTAGVANAYDVSVNGIPHQQIAPLAVKLAQGDYYRIPYRRLSNPRPRDVLVIGAGDGTDVSLALRHGARRVDAVEIDPELLDLGKKKNVDRPYADSRVHSHIADGRAYLERTKRRYDLIVFALPDSLTLVANQSSLRLESYLFTKQAFAAARDRLAPGGAFAIYNFYRKQWLVDRFAGTLRDVFGHAPCIDEQIGLGAVLGPVADLVVAKEQSSQRCRVTWRPPPDTPPPATDDHPFPYLESAGLPSFYAVTLVLVLIASLGGVAAVGVRPGALRPYADLFFMGVAFLLLETKSVVQFALLFGTTWFVNALVFASVLVTILLAIEVAQRLGPGRHGWLYGALLGALALAWLVPADDLLQLPFWPRLLAAGTLAFAPIFLANLIFADRFKATAASATAFGVNLLGAMTGGLLEYASLVIGYRNLLLVVACTYLCAFLTSAGRLRAARPLPLSERA